MFRGLTIAVLSVIALLPFADLSYACHQESFVKERCARVAVAPDTSKIYIVYTDTLNQVVFKRSTDLGTTWSLPVILSQGLDNHRSSMTIDDAGGIYVAWLEKTLLKVYWTYSLDYGETWAEQAPVTTSEEVAFSTEIAVYRNGTGDITVKVASIFKGSIRPKTLRFRWTTDLGKTWSKVTTIDRVGIGRHSIVTDPLQGNANLAYLSAPGSNVFYTRETEIRGEFRDRVNVSQTSPGSRAQMVSLAIPGEGTRYMVWSEKFRVGDLRLRISYSRDFGETWVPAYDVRNDGGASKFPRLVARPYDRENDRLYVVYTSSPGHRVGFMRSLDSGLTWDEPVDLCPVVSPMCVRPDIAIGPSSMLVVTMAASSPGDRDKTHVYFTKSIDDGLSWSVPIQVSREGE